MIKLNFNLRELNDERGAIEFIEGSYLYPTAFILVFVIVFSTIMLWDKAHSDSLLTSKYQIACNTNNFNDPYSISKNEKIEIDEVGILPKIISVSSEKNFNTLYSFRYFKRRNEFKSENYKLINWTSSANDMWHMQAIKKLMSIKEQD